MRIAVTGCSGLVGNSFRELAVSSGHVVVPMVRSRSQEGIYWNPAADEVDVNRLGDVDVVVHLAGDNVAGGRWTAAKKALIRSSRVDGTRLIARALASMSNGPRILINASAIGYYGNRSDEILTEDSTAGTGFLAEVCREWEAATDAAEWAGIRVVRLRIGVVLSKKGGALAKMLTPFRFGAGGIVGSGKQYWSWIALEDVAGAIQHAIGNSNISGAVNVVASNPVSNHEFTKTLGGVVHRPTIFPLPGFAARLVWGEMADELLMSSTRVLPAKLKASGYDFRLPELETALRRILNDDYATRG